MRNIRIFPRLSVAAALVALASVSVGASAASQCKGMQENACVAKAECSWVRDYVRKDGLSVSGHCKTRARRKAADQAALGKVKKGQFN